MARSRRDREADPPSVGSLLSTLVARRGWRDQMALGRLRDGWADIVGAQIASKSEPIKLEHGVLLVRAEGGVWATEITLLRGAIATKADAFLGGDLVKEVNVNGPPSATQTRGLAGRRKP